jgi:hypothetical protein
LLGDSPLDLLVKVAPASNIEERELIDKVLTDYQYLVVFCSSLHWGDMRTLFLDKPYDSARIVSILDGVFANIGTSNALRHGEQEGAG